MADGTTTNYGFTLPEVGSSEDTWGSKLNQNFSDLDSDLASLQSSIDNIELSIDNIELSIDNIELFPSGTAMLFQQTSAPTGWTKSTTHNDKALRVVSGTASSGGSSAFSTAMGTPSVSGTVGISGEPAVGNLAVSMSGNIAVANTTLSVNTIPSHSHTVLRAYGSYDPGYPARLETAGYSSYLNANGLLANTGNNGAHGHSATHNLSGTLSGAPSVGNLAGSLSSATAAINVQYVDIIIATKD